MKRHKTLSESERSKSWEISSVAVSELMEEDGGAMFLLLRRPKQLLINHIHSRFQLTDLYPQQRRQVQTLTRISIILRRELCRRLLISCIRKLSRFATTLIWRRRLWHLNPTRLTRVGFSWHSRLIHSSPEGFTLFFPTCVGSCRKVWVFN